MTATRKTSSTRRGYGIAHQNLRKRWQNRVKAGGVLCARCERPILPTDAWDLDHRDDRKGYLGPIHAACNRSAPAERQRQAGVDRVRPIRCWSRDWYGDGRFHPWPDGSPGGFVFIDEELPAGPNLEEQRP